MAGCNCIAKYFTKFGVFHQGGKDPHIVHVSIKIGENYREIVSQMSY